jgi:hypothetical protein
VPIVDVRIVVEDGAAEAPGSIRALADALAAVFGAGPGRVWLRAELLHRSRYAENGGEVGAMPVFVAVTHADLPEPPALAKEARAVAEAVAAWSGRATDVVHLEYQPPGRGRVAFGGHLLQ